MTLKAEYKKNPHFSRKAKNVDAIRGDFMTTKPSGKKQANFNNSGNKKQVPEKNLKTNPLKPTRKN